MRWLVLLTTGIAGMLLVACTPPPADLLWENKFNRGSLDAVRAMVAEGPRVFAVGPTNAVGNSDMGIVAYDVGDGTILWQRHFDRPVLNSCGEVTGTYRSEDQPRAVAKAPGRIFVAGNTQTCGFPPCDQDSEDVTKHPDTDFSVLAYDSENGRLVGQHHLDGLRGSAPEPDRAHRADIVWDIAVSVRFTETQPAPFSPLSPNGLPVTENLVFVVGSAQQAGLSDAFLIRAYAEGEYPTGECPEECPEGSKCPRDLWEERESSGLVLRWERTYTRTLGINGGSKLVQWSNPPVWQKWTYTDTNSSSNISEMPQWSELKPVSGTAQGVATDGINVYVVGRTILSLDQAPRLPENRPHCANDGDWKDWTVVAYDLNGNFVWDDTYRRPDAYSGAEAIAVVAAEGRVFVGGNTFVLENGECNGDFSVVAYKAADGTRVWWDDCDDPAGGRDGVWNLTVLGDRVFAAGETTTTHLRGSQTLDWLVRAYDAEGDGTGNPRPLWTDVYETGAGDDHAAWVAASGEKVFVAGSTVQGQSDANASHTAWLVRAYDARGDGAENARVLWQDLWDEPGGGEANALVVYGSSVFVGGAVVPVAVFGVASNPYHDFGVRAYQR